MPAPRWLPQPADDLPDGLFLFDGVCVFCSRSVRAVIARDPHARFHFLPLQSDDGRVLAARAGIDADAPQTNAVVRHGKLHFKSDAVLQVLTALPGWRWCKIGFLIPRALRNAAYDAIARRRYQWMGKSDHCWIPTARDRARVWDQLPR